MTYRVGDTLTYRTFMGNERTVRVTQKHDDIKNGFPGFDGVMSGGVMVWGYDDQIVSVN